MQEIDRSIKRLRRRAKDRTNSGNYYRSRGIYDLNVDKQVNIVAFIRENSLCQSFLCDRYRLSSGNVKPLI
jgi:hypothetical protein